jgi:chorismate-pyruvate lyase
MNRRSLTFLCVAALVQVLALTPARAAEGYVQRLRALALLQTLNADLLSHDSATAVLQGWCDAYGPGGLKIVALRLRGQDKPPSEAARAALGLQPGQAAGYRRVRLACGDVVLSEAENWYLKERLTPQMNQALDTSDTPFGAAVRALDFRRRTLSVRLLFQPLAPGWPAAAADDSPLGPLPAEVLQHSAVLTIPNGVPISFVVETYTGQALQMALPRRP